MQNSCGTRCETGSHFMYNSRLHCDSSPQERIVIEKTDQEEAAAAANRPVASVVEHEQHETTETSTSVEMPATTNTIVTTKKYVVDCDVHNRSATTVVTSTADHPLERPANLGLVKQEVNLIDVSSIPSPASPISKQVSRSSNKFLSCSIFSIKRREIDKIKLYWSQSCLYTTTYEIS